MIKKEKVAVNPVIKDDILRYKRNKFAGNFALLALVFNCLYFALLYCIHEQEMKTVLIGASVIVNLLVLLIGFYGSEGVKGYKKSASILLFVLAAVQIIRIFIYPVKGMAGKWLRSVHVFGITIKDTTASIALNGTLMIVFLAASAACFIVAGVFGLIIVQRLENFNKKLESGEVSVEATLAQLDAEDVEAVAKANEAVAAEEVNVAAEKDISTEVAEKDISTENEEKSVSSEEADNG